MLDRLPPDQLLQFYVDSGVDEATGDAPLDWTQIAESVIPEKAASPLAAAQAQPIKNVTPLPSVGAIEALEDARQLSRAATTLEDLKTAMVEQFKGLSIKRTATQIVFDDGNPAARIMLIGDAPANEDDRIGRAFAGPAGQLLDRMLGAIGLDRTQVYLTNVIKWRLLADKPTETQINVSLPFLHRQIALVNPALVVATGEVAARALAGSRFNITKSHGTWQSLDLPEGAGTIPLIALFHPIYLMKSPREKGHAWADLLKIKAKIAELGLIQS